MPVAKKPANPVSDWQKERDAIEAEILSLSKWFQVVYDDAILTAPQDFASDTKAAAFGRQAARKADPKKFGRLQELEIKYRRLL